MRSYCALYVDAGYLLASAATRVTGTSLRAAVTIDHTRLLRDLIAQVERESGTTLLRVNWYDSGGRPGGSPDPTQDGIGMLPRVKLRLGRLSPTGEQKGVDVRIGLDLATHGRNKVADIMYLLSGDDDLTEAVEEAQGHGVQVIVLAVPNADGRPHGVSRNLQREADDVLLIDAAAIDAAVTPTGHVSPHPLHAATPMPALTGPPAPAPNGSHPGASLPGEAAESTTLEEAVPGSPGHGAGTTSAAVPTPAALAGSRPRPRPTTTPPRSRPHPAAGVLVYSSSTGDAARAETDPLPNAELESLVDDVCRSVLGAWDAAASATERADLFGRKPYVPREIDRALLVDFSSRIGMYEIDEVSKFRLRDRFWALAPEILSA